MAKSAKGSWASCSTSTSRLLCLAWILGTCLAFAQTAGTDKTGCADSALLSRIPHCWILDCRQAASQIAMIPSGTWANLNEVGGVYEYSSYACPAETDVLAAARNLGLALQAAGYELLLDQTQGTRQWVTARKGPQWLHLFAQSGRYEFTAVRLPEEAPKPVSWIADFQGKGRAAIAGLRFAPGSARPTAESQAVLQELADLLKKNGSCHVVVAAHAPGKTQDAAVLLSRQRAWAIATWLAGHGIERTRMTTLGFGTEYPAASDSTEEGRALNERIEVIKLY